MDFRLSEEQKIFQTSARKFFEAELLPIVDELEAACEFPAEFYRFCGKHGFLGINIPEMYGGADADTVTCTILTEEISRIDTGFAGTVLTASMAAPLLLMEVGREEQKQRYLDGISTGERIIAFALTEPNAGSDTAGIQTTAREEGDEYVVNGNKTFITNGATADAYILVAYTDKSKGYKGINVFLIDRETPGISVTKNLDKLGWSTSETVELAFEDVRIPRDSRLGREGLGGALELINFGRIMVGAASVGLATAALNEAMRYVKEREAFGRPIAKFQVIRHRLARMQMQIETCRLLTRQAAWRRDRGLSHRKESSHVKYHCGEMAKEVTSKALQLFGGYGYMNEFPVSRYFRDAQVLTIADGTSDIQREVIAREIGLD